ncbi:MAG: D-alanyl-D-alanine carboxypeptidase family protein [Pseudomonadota bacterium]
MKVRHIQPARFGLFVFTAIWFLVIMPLSLAAAPYAAFVMDARTGEVLHSRNADTRLHPASLTKMMTLYIAFEAIQRGEITANTKVKISKFAASEPPSKLGLRPGQRIEFRFLIRAAAVKSANDAATAIGEALEGSEAAFARRMNRTAKALGMSRTTFKNAHGLTEQGHLSTARDMSILGRHMLYDFPQYYNLFSRTSTHAGVRDVANTNRRLLAAYRGADGIKTGYTRAAGFNLVASAERGNERIIATMFGGSSSASRNARVAELLDMGFRRAPSNARLRKPKKLSYAGKIGGKIVRVSGVVKTSRRPVLRPGTQPLLVASTTETATKRENSAVQSSDIELALVEAQSNAAIAETVFSRDMIVKRPTARPASVQLASTAPAVAPEVVSRLSTSGGRHWGVNIGRYSSRYKAEKVLLQTALTEMSTLDGSLRKVIQRPQGFDANFMGLTEETADLACRRLKARNIECSTLGPNS